MTMRRVLLLLPLLGAFALGGCAAALSEAEPAKDVVCLESAKISLSDAVRIAERIDGGHAVAAAYRQDEELGCLVNKPGEYDVTLVSGNMLRTVAVNARDRSVGSPDKGGSILERTSHFLDRLFAYDPVESARLAADAMPDLERSIAVAERSGGKALNAHVDEEDGRLGIVVTLVEDGKTRTAWVDSAAAARLAAN